VRRDVGLEHGFGLFDRRRDLVDVLLVDEVEQRGSSLEAWTETKHAVQVEVEPSRKLHSVLAWEL
jgi:hypothetical protein